MIVSRTASTPERVICLLMCRASDSVSSEKS
nr:MAG TPA: hypothetical protein [Caudoviricetes sp.]